MAFNGYNKIFLSLAGAYAIWMINPYRCTINIFHYLVSQWKKLASKKWYMSEVPSVPYYGYQKMQPDGNWEEWYKNHYLIYAEDQLTKETTGTLMMVLTQAPDRWYGRILLANFYAPVQRETVKFFLAISIDYEALILGFAYGMFVSFRKFLDYSFAKSPQFRGATSVCSCSHNHFYLKHDVTHFNVRKLFRHDRRLFYKKLLMAFPQALKYALVAGVCCGTWNPLWNNHDCVRPPIFWSGILLTYFVFMDDKDMTFYDLPMINYRYHQELQVAGFLLLYTFIRLFRNFVGNYPFGTVLYG
ncbi:hypothetical protein Ocin01_14268 [Orchesella cincta]|uniref:Uncharacterized protein n=1 Tax=Orchesella cincta TaxID=48709 RepID=A0A1D2MHV7_ORCCI|nr:hypothetical protein Ocin01_14268 [Orchesella cincta]